MRAYRMRLDDQRSLFRDLEISDSLYMELCRKREEELSLKDWVAMRTHAQVSEQSRPVLGLMLRQRIGGQEVDRFPCMNAHRVKGFEPFFQVLMLLTWQVKAIRDELEKTRRNLQDTQVSTTRRLHNEISIFKHMGFSAS